MVSCLFYICNVQLAMQWLLSSFSGILWIYFCLFVCSKQVGFPGLGVLVQKQNFSRVWFLKTTLVSIMISLKMRFLLTRVLAKVIKTSNKLKSRVLYLVTLGSIYTPCVAISVILRIKWSVTIGKELSDQSRAAFITSVLMVIDHLREEHQHISMKINSIV